MSKAMNEETEILSEADEIAALLPWYVSGKISTADKARVDTYAKVHPEVLSHIGLARDEADVVFADNQAIHAPRDALTKLQASIAADPRARIFAVKSSLLDKVGEWLGGFAPRQLAYAGLAAALVVAVQAVSISSLLHSQPGSSSYGVANKTEDLTTGSFALVAFQPGALAGPLSAFLKASNFAIVDGPKAGGVYRVRLSDQVLSAADLAAAVNKLKANTELVAFAAPAS